MLGIKSIKSINSIKNTKNNTREIKTFTGGKRE